LAIDSGRWMVNPSCSQETTSFGLVVVVVVDGVVEDVVEEEFEELGLGLSMVVVLAVVVVEFLVLVETTGKLFTLATVESRELELWE